jgi:soluble lytic murein transglycosylase-like protein
MNGRILLAMMAILAPGQVRADLSPIVSQPAGEACRRAVAAAERAHGIPVHLLAAIARVESGRRDQSSGTFSPWPWTINFDGQGSFYDNKVQAVAAATSMRPQVTKSIDIGCMQISLTNHPSAFTTMEQAFDPFSNADYGARFLVQLFEKTGSWPKAVEWYHSATPELGHDYGVKVYAALPEEARLAAIAGPSPLAAAWGATLGHPSSAISPFGQSPARMLPRVTGLGGEVSPGRTLDSYRTNPVRVSFRIR